MSLFHLSSCAASQPVQPTGPQAIVNPFISYDNRHESPSLTLGLMSFAAAPGGQYMRYNQHYPTNPSSALSSSMPTGHTPTPANIIIDPMEPFPGPADHHGPPVSSFTYLAALVHQKFESLFQLIKKWRRRFALHFSNSDAGASIRRCIMSSWLALNNETSKAPLG